MDGNLVQFMEYFICIAEIAGYWSTIVRYTYLFLLRLHSIQQYKKNTYVKLLHTKWSENKLTSRAISK